MKRQVKFIALTAAVLFTVALHAPIADAHCQVPCGIYGDQARFVELKEHITTIEKAMTSINELQKSPSENMNQLVRWVNNKDSHADEIAEIITKYFLQQRIKPEEAKSDHDSWMAKVTACHHILVSSMKAKQSTDLQHVEDLREHLNAFAEAYLSKEDLAHIKDHH